MHFPSLCFLYIVTYTELKSVLTTVFDMLLYLTRCLPLCLLVWNKRVVSSFSCLFYVALALVLVLECADGVVAWKPHCWLQQQKSKQTKRRLLLSWVVCCRWCDGCSRCWNQSDVSSPYCSLSEHLICLCTVCICLPVSGWGNLKGRT